MSASSDARAYDWEDAGGQAWEALDTEGDLDLLDSVDRLNEERRKKDRLKRNEVQVAVRKGIVRNLVVVLDVSHFSIAIDPRFKPARIKVVQKTMEAFVAAFFDQNPLANLATVRTFDGTAQILTELSANPKNHISAIKNRLNQTSGEASIQNAVETARGILQHVPPYGSREVLILSCSLTTRDPGDIRDTMALCKAEKVRCSVVGMGAEVYVYRRLAEETAGRYDIASDKGSFQELVFKHNSPAPTQAVQTAPAAAAGGGGGGGGGGGAGVGPGVGAPAALMRMGFPQKKLVTVPELCACHHELKFSSYVCPRCNARMCDIPSECAVCSLQLVAAPHLARTYHHLFAVKAFEELGGRKKGTGAAAAGAGEGEGAEDGGGESARSVLAAAAAADRCFGCRKRLAAGDESESGGSFAAGGSRKRDRAGEAEGAAAPSPADHMRLMCPDCRNVFCVDCDVYIHEILHNCPGCGVSA